MQFVRSPAKVFRDSGEDAVTHDHDTAARGEQESRKGRATKKFFCLYIGIIAPNQKYLQKKLKKSLEIQFFAVSLYP